MTSLVDFFISIIKFLLVFFGLICISFLSGLIIIKVVGKNELVRVPNIRNKDVEYALNQLNALDLRIEISGKAHSNTIPINYVLSQDPASGEFIHRAQSIKIVLSEGAEEIIVPDITDEPWIMAQTILKESNLQIGKLSWTHHKHSKNLVISQNPQGLSLVPYGKKINILVSEGKHSRTYSMPNLEGLNLNKALEKIKYMGLQPGNIKYIFNDDNVEKNNSVISQNPLPGYYIEEGSEVDLQINKRKQIDNEVTGVYKVFTYTIPTNSVKGVIRVVVHDDFDIKEIYKKVHSPGDELELLVKTKKNSKILIYLNDELIKEKQF